MAKANSNNYKLPVLPHGEGSMSYMPDGRIIYKKTINKKRISVYGSSVKEVLNKMKIKEKEAAKQSKQREKINKHHELLYEGLYRWLEKYKKLTLKPASYDRAMNVVKNQIEKYPIGHMEIDNVTKDDVQDLMNTLIEKNYSYSTIKKTYELLNGFFKFEYSNEPYGNIMLGTVKPKQRAVNVDVKEIDFFDDEDIKKMVNVADLRYDNNKPIYQLGWGIIGIMFTGMRVSEALALKWEDVDLVNGKITITKTASIVRTNDENKNSNYEVIYTSPKTKAGNREIPLSKNAIEAFENLKEIQTPNTNDEYVFATKTGKPIGLRNLRRLFNNMQQRAHTSVQNSGMHVLRHTFCSLLVRNRIDKVVIANILGQEGTDMIEKVYQHVSDKEKFEAINSIDKYTVLK